MAGWDEDDDSAKRRDYVVISTPGRDDGYLAHVKPQVILKFKGAFYLTFACWEYDPRAPNLTREDCEAIEEIERLYHEATPLEGARLLKTNSYMTPNCNAHKAARRSAKGIFEACVNTPYPPTSP